MQILRFSTEESVFCYVTEANRRSWNAWQDQCDEVCVYEGVLMTEHQSECVLELRTK